MAWETELDRMVKERLPGLDYREREPLSRHTSFHIGGPAARMAFPDHPEAAERLLDAARLCGARPLVIGSGTNLLCPDEGLDRLVVNLTRLNRVEAGDGGETDREACVITAQAGASLRKTAEFAASRGLAGLAFAHGIPGSVGGGVCMNAGAYGGEMVQVVEYAAVLFPGEGVRKLSREELNLSYRHSLLTDRPELTVLYAVLRLKPGDPAEIRAEQRELMERRKASQPLEYPSAGSTFKRPPGHYAGTLIQQCGLKGLSVGGAQVSEKHAGFIINRGGATCADVAALIAEVQRRVLEETGVALEPEVRIVR